MVAVVPRPSPKAAKSDSINAPQTLPCIPCAVADTHREGLESSCALWTLFIHTPTVCATVSYRTVPPWLTAQKANRNANNKESWGNYIVNWPRPWNLCLPLPVTHHTAALLEPASLDSDASHGIQVALRAPLSVRIPIPFLLAILIIHG